MASSISFSCTNLIDTPLENAADRVQTDGGEQLEGHKDNRKEGGVAPRVARDMMSTICPRTRRKGHQLEWRTKEDLDPST
ncbi:hypothetical protein PENANT_c179G03160 [Penicillium antarcticum]|uniref:Uncharacterized protein n=1 Tax=Penicillium antarcticum TaxID=416450 RepID=A0A1V6PC93_9EURO|nr:hypothetical protein PENANT_c179G03160 [Penicillium antarcticum]